MISGSDWVSFGVLYYKSCQTSKAGNSYTLCKVSDLNIAGGGGGDIASVTVFFFGAAHTRHYKIPLNKVVGILNAKVQARVLHQVVHYLMLTTKQKFRHSTGRPMCSRTGFC